MGDDAPQHTGFRRRCGASGIGEPLVTVVPLLLLEAMGNRKTQLRVAGSGRRQRVFSGDFKFWGISGQRNATCNMHFPGWGKLENMGSGDSHRRRWWAAGFGTYFPLQGERAPGERSSHRYSDFKFWGISGQKMLHVICISRRQTLMLPMVLKDCAVAR